MICQKCLNVGHWSYECKAEKAYVQRESRSKILAEHRPPKFNLELPPGSKELEELKLKELLEMKTKKRKRKVTMMLIYELLLIIITYY